MNKIAYYLSGISLKMAEVFMEVGMGRVAMVVEAQAVDSSSRLCSSDRLKKCDGTDVFLK
ncbi:hypothetical protein ACFLW6_01315 [Chloroflexota bacterium]